MTASPRVLGVAWLPIDRASLCVGCHAFYDGIAQDECPACGAVERRLIIDIIQTEGVTA